MSNKRSLEKGKGIEPELKRSIIKKYINWFILALIIFLATLLFWIFYYDIQNSDKLTYPYGEILI